MNISVSMQYKKARWVERGYIYDIFSLGLSLFPFQGELNLSLSQSPQPPNNRTLQSFIEAYLGEHTGGLMCW